MNRMNEIQTALLLRRIAPHLESQSLVSSPCTLDNGTLGTLG
jgi:hypothetical protein